MQETANTGAMQQPDRLRTEPLPLSTALEHQPRRKQGDFGCKDPGTCGYILVGNLTAVRLRTSNEP